MGKLKRVIRVFRSARLWNQAINCAIEKNYAGCIAALDLLAEKYPPNVNEHLLRSLTYFNQKELVSSAEALKLAHQELLGGRYIGYHNEQYLLVYMHHLQQEIVDKDKSIGTIDIQLEDKCDFDQVSKTYSSIFQLQ